MYVCVKSVPASDTVAFDTKNGTLKRTGRDMEANPCDVVAVEAALQLAQKQGGSSAAVSMGPADTGLRTALAMGIDRGYLLQSNGFAGADVPATAYTLAAFFKQQARVDVIFCGKHSADGDTGQTGAMLAEQLGIAHACSVSKIEEKKNGMLELVQRLEDREIILQVKPPCLIIVRNDFCIPRNPTLQGILHARKQEIHVEDEQSIADIDLGCCGLKGSATKVKRLFVPPNERKTKRVTRENILELRPYLEELGHYD